MAPIAAGSPFRRPRSRSRGPTPRSPSPPPLPPKNYIDLNSSTRSADPEVSTRAYLCDVVVVGSENNETTALLSQLGDVVERPTAIPRPKSQPSSADRTRIPESDDATGGSASKQEELDKRLRALIEELVRTERSYVSRIKALKNVSGSQRAKSSLLSHMPIPFGTLPSLQVRVSSPCTKPRRCSATSMLSYPPLCHSWTIWSLCSRAVRQSRSSVTSV